ncbi:MAG: putative toxin-antitoxin system toxin component, PIN family [Paludibacteraceae bacterium]|nr:putative toxin-antitoxin system toxin component, PIN family [Paludibacteraceae bacterium]
MKIVLDTNVLVRILYPNSVNHLVWEKLLDAEYIICYTTDILLEYEEILTELFSVNVANAVVSAIVSLVNSERITPYYKLNLIKGDKDDNKFVDCAFAANASYIVTDDKHFKELKKIDFPKIETLKLAEFRKRLSK